MSKIADRTVQCSQLVIDKAPSNASAIIDGRIYPGFKSYFLLDKNNFWNNKKIIQAANHGTTTDGAQLVNLFNDDRIIFPCFRMEQKEMS